MSATVLFLSLNVIGSFMFGLSGAMVAIRRRLDIFGILVLSVTTGVAGGIWRDGLPGWVMLRPGFCKVHGPWPLPALPG